MATKKRYSDLDLDFITHPVSGDISLKYDEEAVKRSVRNLVFMGIHEKPFHKLLFENFSPITKFELKKEIEDIIREYEPRARTSEVIVVQSDDENRLDVTIKFEVLGVTNRLFEITMPLERIR